MLRHFHGQDKDMKRTPSFFLNVNLGGFEQPGFHKEGRDLGAYFMPCIFVFRTEMDSNIRNCLLGECIVWLRATVDAQVCLVP